MHPKLFCSHLKLRQLCCIFAQPMRKTLKSAATEPTVLIVSYGANLSTNLQRFLRHKAETAGWNQEISSRRALPSVIRLQPGLVVVDMPEPGRVWNRLISQIKTTAPDIKVLVVGGENDPRSADRVLRAGADGYVLWRNGSDELAHAIHDVMAGGIYLSEEVLAVPTAQQRASKTQGSRPGLELQRSTFRESRRRARVFAGRPPLRFSACREN
jgi:DNA-binding NarL/FixJ family response regulator